MNPSKSSENSKRSLAKISVFENAEFGSVRTAVIDGEPLFVGKDVAAILGYANSNEAVQEHVDEEDKLNSKTLSSSGLNLGQRGGWLINESGLYSLILSSKLPAARKFKRWVTSEILPAIRKTGGYSSSASLSDKNASLERAFEIMAKAFETIAETQKMQESRLQKIEEHIEERKALLPAPQVKPRDHINMIVRSYVSESGMSYADCWRELYRQFGYRTNTNPRKCAENRGMGILDYIETEGQIETLEAVAMDIYGITNKQKDIARRTGDVTQKAVENYYAIGKAE